MLPAMLLPLLLLQVLQLVHSQTVINVTVGVSGSFFDPRTVSAAAGDTVNFIFGGDFHDVTQSTFQEPCTPLPGGFSSGLFGRGANFDGNLTMWSLTITNASAPIWYFCAATRPSSHCVTSGMVGAINPPSQAMYNQFVSAAQHVSSTPAFFPTLVLTGSGAVAASPVIIETASPATLTTSSPSSTSTSSASSTPSASPSGSGSSNHGAVIGGSVAAAVVGVLLLLLGGYFCYRRRRQRRISQNSSFFSYNPHPSQHHQQSTSNTVTSGRSAFNSAANSPNYITAFDIERESNVMMQKQPLLPMTSPAVAEHPNALAPQRYNGGNTYHVGAPGPSLSGQSSGSFFNTPSSINRQISFNPMATPSSTPTHVPPDNSSTTNDSGIGVDIHTLAKEVVAVLRQEKMVNEAASPASSAPPRYHTVTE